MASSSCLTAGCPAAAAGPGELVCSLTGLLVLLQGFFSTSKHTYQFRAPQNMILHGRIHLRAAGSGAELQNGIYSTRSFMNHGSHRTDSRPLKSCERALSG